MLRTAQLLPLTRAFDTALRRRAFPPDAGSLLPGPLAATRTGLAPAGNDELPTESDHVITQPPSNCRAYSRVPWNFGGGPVSIRLRSPRHCARRVRQVRRIRVRALLGVSVGAGGR